MKKSQSKKDLNIRKVIAMLKFLQENNEDEDHLLIKDGKLYFATWEVDYHNGDIDNYKTHLMTEKEAEAQIESLENSCKKILWQNYKEQKKEELFAQKLYDITHEQWR